MLNCLKSYRTEPSRQVDKSGLTQSEQSLLTYHLGFLVKVRSAYSYLLRLLFKDREERRVSEAVRGQQLR